MKCPVCGKTMIVVERNKVELDYCAGCQGVWFDASELDLLLESAGVGNARNFERELLTPDKRQIEEKKRKCPICATKMNKRVVGGEPAITIDMCRHGHGIWFDGGELEHLVRHLALPAGHSDTEALRFVGEALKSAR